MARKRNPARLVVALAQGLLIVNGFNLKSRTRAALAPAALALLVWLNVQPGTLRAFEFAIPAASLKSEKDGLDKNMYKALNTKEHPQITFSLKKMEGAPGALKALGVLTSEFPDASLNAPNGPPPTTPNPPGAQHYDRVRK